VSDISQRRVIPPKRKRSLQSKAWIAASLFVSACIITWTFSLPFRLADSATQNQIEREQQAEDIQQKRTRAEERREEAFANHKQFVQSMVRKRESTLPKPGNLQVRKHWKKRVAKVKKKLSELDKLGDPKNGSIQWVHKQALVDSLDDGPL